MGRQTVLLYFIIATVILGMMVMAIVISFVRYQKRQLLHLHEKESLRRTFDNQLLQAKLETQEQTFRYISEELHDNVNQILAVVGMHLYQLQGLSLGDPACRLAEQGSVLLNKAINDIRMLSHTLNVHYVSQAGLVEILSKELAYINSVRDVKSSLEVIGVPVALSMEHHTLLYRIIQEAIMNALKHAHATEINVTLRFNNDYLTTTISDNGTGFDPGASESGKAGLGLNNMQLRAKLLGDILKIESKWGEGTIISLNVPLSLPA